MVAGFDELIAFLLDEISFCGTRGVAAADLGNLVTTFYQNHGETSATGAREQHLHRQSDRRLVAKVWTWLADHPDVLFGANGQWNHISFEDFEGRETLHASQNADVSKDESEAAIRIFTNEDRMWQAVAGHSKDTKLIPPLEFQALCIIASFREAGIIQPELVQLTGQDKRSLPKRTDVLAERGYIEKIPIFIRKHKTSLLRHRRYARAQSGVWSANGIRNDPFSDSHFDLDSFVNILLATFGAIGVTTMQDFYVAVGVEPLDVFKQRTSRRTLDTLQSIGLISRFRAPCGIPTKEARYIPCIKLLRAPRVDDRDRAFNDKKQKATGTILDQDLPLSIVDSVAERAAQNYEMDNAQTGSITNEGDDQAFDDSEESFPSSWDPDAPYLNAIQQAVSSSGSIGIGSTELRARTFGTIYLRPVENILARLTDTWETSQPPHLRHLAVVRDSSLVERNAQYLYRTYTAFQDAVAQGELTWEAVLGRHKDPSKLPKAKLDAWGFVEINKNFFYNRSGTSSLSQMLSAVKVVKQAIMSREPRLVIDSDGRRKLTYERLSSTPIEHSKKTYTKSPAGQKASTKAKKTPVISTRPPDDLPTIAGIPAAEYRRKYQAKYQAKRLAQQRLPQVQRYAAYLAKQEAVVDFLSKVHNNEIEDLIVPDAEVQSLLDIRDAKSRSKSGQIASRHDDDVREGDTHNAIPPKTLELPLNPANQSDVPLISSHVTDQTDTMASSAVKLIRPTRTTRNKENGVSDPSPHVLGRTSRKRKVTERGAELQQALTSKRVRYSKMASRDAEKDSGDHNARADVPEQHHELSLVGTGPTIAIGAAATFHAFSHRRKTTAWMKPIVASSARIQQLIPILADSTKSGVHVQPIGSKPSYASLRGAGKSLIVCFKFEWLRKLQWFMENTSGSTSCSPQSEELSIEQSDSNISLGNIAPNTRHDDQLIAGKIFEDVQTPSIATLPAVRTTSATGQHPTDSVVLALSGNHSAIQLSDISSNLVQKYGVYRVRKRGRQRANQRQLALKFVLPVETLRKVLGEIGNDSSTLTDGNAGSDSQPLTNSNVSFVENEETLGDKESLSSVTVPLTSTKPSTVSSANTSAVEESEEQPERELESATSEATAHQIGAQYHDRYHRTPSKYVDWNVREVSKRERITSRKKGVQLGGGSSRFRKSQIIMEILSSCEGVIGGDNEIVRPYRALYSKKFGSKQVPDRDTVAKAVKNVVDQGKLKRVAFIFEQENRTTVTRHLLMQPDVFFDGPIAQAMVENIKKAYPRQYLPAHLYIGEGGEQKDPEVRFKDIDDSIQVVPQDAKLDEAIDEPEAPWETRFASRRKELAAARDAAYHHEQASTKRAWTDDTGDVHAKRPRILYSAKAFSSSNYLQRFLKSEKSPQAAMGNSITNGDGRSAAARRIEKTMELEEATVPGRAVLNDDMTVITMTPWTVTHQTASVGNAVTFEGQGREDSQSDPVVTSVVTDQEDQATNEYSGLFRAKRGRRSQQRFLQSYRNRFMRPAQFFHISTGTFSSLFTTAHWTWQYYHDAQLSITEKHKNNSILKSSATTRPQAYDDVQDQSHEAVTLSSGRNTMEEIHTELQLWQNHGFNMKVNAQDNSGFINYSMNHNHQTSNLTAARANAMPRNFTDYPLNTQQASEHMNGEVESAQWLRVNNSGAMAGSIANVDKTAASVGPKVSKMSRNNKTRPPFYVQNSAKTAKATNGILLSPARPSYPQGPRSKQNVDCVIDIETSKTLLYSVVVVRTLAGGLDRTVKWKTIDELFKHHPHYCQTNFKNRWHQMSKGRPDIIEKLQDEFEDAFLHAYGRGILPPFDMSLQDSYDWQGIIEWAMQEIDVTEDIDQITLADVLDGKYHFTTTNSHSESLRDDFLRPVSTTIRRTYAMNMIDTSLQLQHRHDTAETMLSRSWVRSAVDEGDRIISSAEAAIKLQSLDESTLRRTIESLLGDKVIQSKTKRFGPFVRNDQLPLVASLRTYQSDVFTEAVAFKDTLDQALQSNSQPMMVSQAMTSSQALALSEMLLNGRIVTKAIMPEINNDVVGVQPRLSVWGLNDGGYQSRKIDTDAMFWPLEIQPTDTYEYGRPVETAIHHAAIPMRPAKDHPERARIPYWATFDGSLRVDHWRRVILVVLPSLAQRAGCDASVLACSLKGSLDIWELELALEWLEEIGAARKLCGAWYAAEWWWMVLPCLSYLGPEGREAGDERLAESRRRQQG